jgi:hypothetical protein
MGLVTDKKAQKHTICTSFPLNSLKVHSELFSGFHFFIVASNRLR